MSENKGEMATTSTAVRSQFWRESERRWVDHVNIRTWGPEKDQPRRWRHRVITTTVTTGDWQDGTRPTRIAPPADGNPR